MKETEESFSLTSLEEANVKSEERRAEEPIDAPVLTNNLSSDLEKERSSLAEDRKPQAAEESGMHHTHHEHQSHNEYHVHHSHHSHHSNHDRSQRRHQHEELSDFEQSRRRKKMIKFFSKALFYFFSALAAIILLFVIYIYFG